MSKHQDNENNQRHQESSQNPVTPPTITCRWCGYDVNSTNAFFCEVCHRSLAQEETSQKFNPQKRPKFFFSKRLLGLSSLALFITILGGAWFWKNFQTRSQSVSPPLPINDSGHNSNPDTSVVIKSCLSGPILSMTQVITRTLILLFNFIPQCERCRMFLRDFLVMGVVTFLRD
jgi:hypothetical protein